MCKAAYIDDLLRQLVEPGDLVDSGTVADIAGLSGTSHAAAYLVHETARGRFELVGKLVKKTDNYRRGVWFVYRVTEKFLEPRTFRRGRNHQGSTRNRSWTLPELVTLDAGAITVL